MDEPCCSDNYAGRHRIQSVKFNTETGETFDQDGNFIGIGVFKDGMLTITRKIEDAG